MASESENRPAADRHGSATDTLPPRLYFMPRTRSIRALWMLEEIGMKYDLTQIFGAERRSAEHLRRHPLGRVPALELGDGTTMFESAAICLQLADMNPAAGLIPPLGSTKRALAYQWVLFSVTELEAPLFRWIHEIRTGTAAESDSRDRFRAGATAIASALDGSDWLLGETFTVADLMCASVLQGARSRKLLDPWPRLEAYVQQSESRPAYSRAAAISDRPRT